MDVAFVRALLAGAPVRIRSVADLRAYRGEACAREAAGEAAGSASRPSVEQAALGGLVAGSLGWAFAAGYQAALARLDPQGIHGGALGSLCATEEGGGHPRAIRASLTASGDRFVLSGAKSFVTLGADADVLLVVASTGQREVGEGDERGRNRLRVARIPSRRAGVTILAGPPLPFVPEIVHAKATFEAVAVGASELLPGDGYDDALKPFRTIEDIHVNAAVLGWAVGVAKVSDWPAAWIEEALGLVLLLCSLGGAPPLAPETHIVLAGAQAAAHRLLDAASWSTASAEARSCWDRDRRLLEVASGVRAARLRAAWGSLAG
jgi:acyl-CoA dehydrogenase